MVSFFRIIFILLYYTNSLCNRLYMLKELSRPLSSWLSSTKQQKKENTFIKDASKLIVV